MHAFRVHGGTGVQHRRSLSTKIEEIFYLIEGELDLRCGERTVRSGPGTCVFVPPASAHAFGKSGAKPGRMLLITAPRGHEKYFDELRDLIVKDGKSDPDAFAKPRAEYDTGATGNIDTALFHQPGARVGEALPELAALARRRALVGDPAPAPPSCAARIDACDRAKPLS